MFLSKLNISNFRCIKKIELPFQKGANIIIGENNSGKSAIIDALRIGFGYGKFNNKLSVQKADLHLNVDDPNDENREIQFDYVFEIEDEEKEIPCFNDFRCQDPSDPSKQTIQFHLKYVYEGNDKRNYFKRSVWGGDNEGQGIPYEALEEIFFIYLDPLRDAIYSLKPYSHSNKVGNLFNQLTRYTKDGVDVKLDERKKASLAEELHQVFDGETSDWEAILRVGNEKVNDHLQGTGIASRYPKIQMNYVGREYSDIVRGIELKRPIFKGDLGRKQKYFDLQQNGLGENNLIYTSVVLGDLINRSQDEDLQIYNALLVEEPEAHLHPQYQNTFFEYLNQMQSKGVQTFITSHSPTITAKSNLRNVTILQKQDERVGAFSFSTLDEDDLSKRNRNHLRKFLDTSRSQLFFASGVILVEGIAEALLLPILSRKFLKIDLEKEGIEIVNINGVAFEHFAKLFNSFDKNKRLLSKCSIITDSDPKDDKPKSDRALKAEGYDGGNLKVCLASKSFEHDLFNESETNKNVLRFVYRGMHPKTKTLKSNFSVEEFWEKLDTNDDKGDFALELQDQLNEVVGFEIPQYIKDAINWVVKIDDDVK